MKRILMLAFAATLSVGASACQDTTSPSAVLSGTYTLQSIANQPLPVLLPSSSTLSSQVIAGQITINRDGSFTDIVRYQDTQSGSTTGAPYDVEIDGTWTLSGNVLSFTDYNDPYNPYQATVSNGQLIFTASGSGGSYYNWVYSK